MFPNPKVFLVLFLVLFFSTASIAQNNSTETVVIENEKIVSIVESKNAVLPLFNLSIPSSESIFANVRSFSVQSTKIDLNEKRVVVSLKDPFEIKAWNSALSSMDSDSIDELQTIMRDHTIHSHLDYADVKHIFSSFNGFSAAVSQEEFDALKANPFVKEVQEDATVQKSLQDSVSLINASNIWQKQLSGVNLTGVGQSVCVIDTGVDYTHEHFNSCSAPTSIVESYSLTSPNYPSEYANNYDNTWTITKPGYKSISVFFEDVDLEFDFDFIIVYDSNDTALGFLTGEVADTWSPPAIGDTIKVRLVTDSSNPGGPYRGFSINATRDLTPNWSNCTKVIEGYDFVNFDLDPMDDDGHGTHVAGIVAANGSLQGVAPDANIIAIKSLDSRGLGLVSDVVAGIEYCSDLDSTYNVSTISMSLGGSINYSSFCDSQETSYAQAINYANSRGIAVIVASGNDANSSAVSSPACIQNAIPVGSTDKFDVMSSFSNRNALVSLVAPGSVIESTRLGGGTQVYSGTSMATPHVAGAYAILYQFLLSQSLSRTPQEIETIFSSTGKDIIDTGFSELTYSRINISGAIQSLDQLPPDVSILYPLANGLFFANSSILINFTISDATLQSCTWTRDAGLTNTSFNCSSPIQGELWSQGNNTVTIYATDVSNNQGFATRDFVIDSIAPNLSIIFPSASGLEFTELVPINFSASDTNIDSCFYSLNSGPNISISNCANVSAINWSQGLNTIVLYVNDSAGNMNVSTLNVTLDTIAPNLSITFPSASGLQFTEFIPINFSASDANLDSCFYSLNDGPNISISSCTNISNVTWIQGENSVVLYVNDSFGKMTNETIIFSIDTILPRIDVQVSPLQNTSYNRSTKSIHVNLNFTEIIQNISYSIDNISFNITNALINQTQINSSIVLPFYGDTQITLFYADTFGNSNSTTINFSTQLFFENGTVVDIDGDGLNNSQDSILGNASNVKTTFSNLTIEINGSDNLTQNFSGIFTISFKDANQSIVDLPFNLSNESVLNLSDVVLVSQDTENNSKLLISGVSLAQGNTKTIYLDLLGNTSIFGSICVKDAEIISFDEITANCSGVNESYFLTVPSSANGISLAYTNSSNTTVAISGLSNSGVFQTCTESWTVSNWGSCSGGIRTRTVIDENSCGTIFNMPAASESCSLGSGGGSSGGGGGGGSRFAGPSSFSVELDLEKNTTIVLNREYDIKNSNFSFTVTSFSPFIVTINGTITNQFTINNTTYSIEFLGNRSKVASEIVFKKVPVIPQGRNLNPSPDTEKNVSTQIANDTMNQELREDILDVKDSSSFNAFFVYLILGVVIFALIIGVITFYQYKKSFGVSTEKERDLTRYIFSAKNANHSDKQIISDLVSKGWSKEYAEFEVKKHKK